MSDQPNESSCGTKRRSKITYSREFLLSLSGLEICKKLPRGFDESILSEFEDQERHRIPGSLSSHGFRRSEYGSSPPTRGELNNYSRGIHGRWESRSSRSDKDADSQSDRDSDSGKRYTKQSWQTPEHDGLLGSGSFPRPSGHLPGVSAPKFRPNDNYQLNRTSEPYHPPRPYKAVPHPRRETNDSFNDETFGSSQSTSEDKAEEERKRRASFELMRKEQHKAFQERQKTNPGRQTVDFDISTLMEDSRHEKRTVQNINEVDGHVPQECFGGTAKSSLSSQAPAPRPLVPPGFAGAMHERKSNTVEVKMVSEGNVLRASDKIIYDDPSDQDVKQVVDKMGLTMEQRASTDIHMTLSAKDDKNASPVLDISIQPLDVKDLFGNDHLSNVMEPSSTDETLKVDYEKPAGNKTGARSSNSITVLEELFGSALTLDDPGSSNVLKQQHGQGEDSWSPHTVQSSKFARWFLQEDKEPSVPSPQPNELLSLIVGGDKSAPLVPDAQAPEQLWPNSLFLGTQFSEGTIASTTLIAATNKSSDLSTDVKVEAAPAVLTCEDLENSILSEVSDSATKQQQPPLQLCGINDAEVNGPSATVDNRASMHLLSLLQKGTDHGDALPILNVNAKFLEDMGSGESETVGNEPVNPKDSFDGTLPDPGKTLTLETLFGTAFMQELQSVGAPVSAQKGPSSAGSAKAEAAQPQAFHHTQIEADVLTNRNGSATGGLTLNQRRPSDLDKLDKKFGLIDELQTNRDIPQFQTELRLPEEDSLLAVNGTLNLRRFMPGNGPPTKSEVLSSQTTPADIAEKLATLNGSLNEKFVPGQGPFPFHDPLNKREPDLFQNLHLQQSSPPLHPQQFNPVGTNFHPLDSYPGHNDPQMKLMAQDFHGNMIRPPFQHSGTGFTGFDPPPSHHHPLLQQMHMTGGFPPAHQFQGFMRPPQLPNSHLNHQLPGFNHEMNPMQGLPFSGHRQPNFGGLDIPHPGPDMRGNSNPEALQRLIEMELRNGSSKQIHPMAAAGGGGGGSSHGGMYGPELDMGFRYR